MRKVLTFIFTISLSFGAFSGTGASTTGTWVDCEYNNNVTTYEPLMICDYKGGKRKY